MKVIAFAGMPFSGKSEAVKIAKDMNIPVIRMGDMIWEETKNRGLELSDKNVGTIANNMRKEHGMDIWAKRTLDKIKSTKDTKILVIDGVRNIEEIETFEKELGEKFILIAVDVTDETRYKRAMNRGREDDSQDIKLIKERDKRELSWGLGNVIASADVIISNEGPVEEFKQKIKDLFNKI
ncbi:MAG: flagellar hook-basal body complex protein FliE [Thermoplasmatales archaeon]|nr:flagellar hook-basal body complex protein FliE [Thermoplasmatales archaeon]